MHENWAINEPSETPIERFHGIKQRKNVAAATRSRDGTWVDQWDNGDTSPADENLILNSKPFCIERWPNGVCKR